MRKVIFADGEYYHIYNRGVDKRNIFIRPGHYIRFITTISNLLNYGRVEYKNSLSPNIALKTKISFICYCLMPNHYHFLVKQKEEKGITDFMHRLNTSYTKYFDLNNDRTGRLFEYTFKAVHIEEENQLIHLTRYIHLNPYVNDLVKNLEDYPWSSYLDYIGKRNGKICEKDIIYSYMNTKDPTGSYRDFVMNQAEYAHKLAEIKKLLSQQPK